MTVEILRAAGYEKHQGGAAGAPMLLEVPDGNMRPVEAVRAAGLNLAVQHVEGVTPFVSLALITLGGSAIYLAMTAADLRSSGAALLRSADDLDGGSGKQ